MSDIDALIDRILSTPASGVVYITPEELDNLKAHPDIHKFATIDLYSEQGLTSFCGRKLLVKF